MKKKTSVSKNKNLNGKPFPIVAIGASAGGLEAATELFKHIPSDTGMAYIYIQHLDRDYKSKLAEIISKSTSIGVEQARNNIPVERNKLYIIPPNKDMSLMKGALKLNTRKASPTPHMPIDTFFASLAEHQREGSIGVLLSGTAHDGTAG